VTDRGDRLKPVAATGEARTVLAMTTTASPDSGPDEETELAALITSLGKARQADEATGGPLWAAFGDFCYASNAEATPDLLALWLQLVTPPPSSIQIDRLTRIFTDGGLR
jgi:hypothetical protein